MKYRPVIFPSITIFQVDMKFTAWWLAHWSFHFHDILIVEVLHELGFGPTDILMAIIMAVLQQAESRRFTYVSFCFETSWNTGCVVPGELQ